MDDLSLEFDALQAAYEEGRATPTAVVSEVLSRISARGDDGAPGLDENRAGLKCGGEVEPADGIALQGGGIGGLGFRKGLIGEDR